jgi:putative alpha-1,2-mannosidase
VAGRANLTLGSSVGILVDSVCEIGFSIRTAPQRATDCTAEYAHSNQPSHFTLPFFGPLNEPGKLDYWVHRVARDLYRTAPDGLPGDEDNGEMFAWWLCALIGLMPVCPGSAKWMRTKSSALHSSTHSWEIFF